MITFKGYPEDGGLYTEYKVLRDGQTIGSVGVGGFFHSYAKLSLEERRAIRTGCKKVYEMPSEYGCLGVGEKPTEPFDENNCGV